MFSEYYMSDRKGQILYVFTYMYNLKSKKKKRRRRIEEQIQQRETDSQIQRTNQCLPEGRGMGEGQNR